MIALRKLFKVFGRGSLHFLHPSNRKILAYIRSYEFEDGHCETILCVANLSRFAQPVQLDLSRYAGRQPVEMLGYVAFPAVDKTPYALTLAPYSSLWLELQEGAPIPEAPVVDAPAQEPAERALQMTAMPGGSLGALLTESSRALLEQVLPSFIAQRRWFGGKSRSIRSAQLASVTPIPGTSAALSTVSLLYEDGTSDQYQLPLALATDGEAEDLREKAPNTIIATLNRETGPVTLYDATASTEFRTSLLQLIVKGSEIALELGASQASFAATKASTFDGHELLELPSRVGSAEQSNTSIIIGDQAILKLFRRLRAGENPDVEITRFLTEVAHYANIPAYLGDLHRTDDETTLAFLQVFAPNEGDGWEWTLEELGRYFESVANCPTPTNTGQPAQIGERNEVPAEAREHAGLFLEAAHLLGRRTGELHVALATPTTNPAFAAEPFNDHDLAAERERILAQAQTALSTLQDGMDRVPAEAREDARRLAGAVSAVEELLAGLNGEATHFGQRIRIHGDYHLGQTLRSRSDFLLVDFEGEPARTLEERRRKQSPLRDVAGMLRSFSYATQAGLQRATQRRPDTTDALRPWARLWENASAAAYLEGYADAVKARPELLPQPAEAKVLLSSLLLEKAFYELLYELNNRPAWLSIPLHGLLTLLAQAGKPQDAEAR